MTTADDRDRNELTAPLEDEHDPPGEDQGEHSDFSADQVARAFDVGRERVVRAFDGEFRIDDSGLIDSRQAQHLADVLLADKTQEERDTALIKLGAFTPRRDTIAPSVSEKAPGEIDDTRLAPDSRRRGPF